MAILVGATLAGEPPPEPEPRQLERDLAAIQLRYRELVGAARIEYRRGCQAENPADAERAAVLGDFLRMIAANRLDRLGEEIQEKLATPKLQNLKDATLLSEASAERLGEMVKLRHWRPGILPGRILAEWRQLARKHRDFSWALQELWTSGGLRGD